MFPKLNDEPKTFIKKHVIGRAKKSFVTAKHDILDWYRRMITEIDPVSVRTKRHMMEAIAGMVSKGRTKNPKEQNSRLLDLEVMVAKYIERICEVPDDTVLAAIIANVLGREDSRDLYE